MMNVIRHRLDLKESPLEIRFRKAWESRSYHIILDQEFLVDTSQGRRRIDFAHQSTKTAIELDGYEYHKDPEKFTDDRQRQRELLDIGWIVIPFSGSEIMQNISKCVEDSYQYITKRAQSQMTLQRYLHNIHTSTPMIQVQPALSNYQLVLEALKQEQPSIIPMLALQLAEALCELPDKAGARECIYYSMRCRLQLSGIAEADDGIVLSLVYEKLYTMDWGYIALLKKCLLASEDSDSIEKATVLEEALRHKLWNGEVSHDIYGRTLYGVHF